MYLQKNREHVFVDHKTTQRVADLLTESDKAIRAGNNQHAYELSLQATQLDPDNLEAWLLRATLAASLEERIICANRLNELAPSFQDRHNVAFFAFKELLERDPFLAYLEETDDLYRTVHADYVLNIPKKRAVKDIFPLEGPGPLTGAYRLLTMAFMGLLVSGIGTIIFAPLAVIAALQAQGSVRSSSERLKSKVVLMVASGLFLIGVLFSVLFILHWLG